MTSATKLTASSGEEGRAAQRAAEREQMKQAIETLQTSQGWRRWLRVRAQFRDYSFANTILVAFQRPEATHVAGFRAWLGLGYCVRRGETAIRIWAPMPPSKSAVRAWREAGSPPDQEPRTHFRLVPVFDRSQVDPLPEHRGGPAPLEPPHQPVIGDRLERLRQPLTDFAAGLKSEVVFEPIPGAAAGYHEPATGRIVIDNGADRSPNAEIQTLVHELAHLLIRADCRDEDPKLSYRAEEVVVESVAYTVCAGLGLDTSGDSAPYLAGWGGEEAGDQIEAYAALIDRLASRLEQVLSAEDC